MLSLLLYVPWLRTALTANLIRSGATTTSKERRKLLESKSFNKCTVQDLYEGISHHFNDTKKLR